MIEPPATEIAAFVGFMLVQELIEELVKSGVITPEAHSALLVRIANRCSESRRTVAKSSAGFVAEFVKK